MPEMDGFEATKFIRKSNRHYQNIPIVAITANAVVGFREKCIEAGMDDYVAKPIRVPELMEALRKVKTRK